MLCSHYFPQGWLGLDCNISLSELTSALAANGSWLTGGSGSQQDETLAPDYDANPADTNTTDANTTDSDPRNSLDREAGCTKGVPTTITGETIDTPPLDVGVGGEENVAPGNPTTK